MCILTCIDCDGLYVGRSDWHAACRATAGICTLGVQLRSLRVVHQYIIRNRDARTRRFEKAARLKLARTAEHGLENGYAMHLEALFRGSPYDLHLGN